MGCKFARATITPSAASSTRPPAAIRAQQVVEVLGDDEMQVPSAPHCQTTFHRNGEKDTHICLPSRCRCASAGGASSPSAKKAHTLEFVILEHGLGGSHTSMEPLASSIREEFEARRQCQRKEFCRGAESSTKLTLSSPDATPRRSSLRTPTGVANPTLMSPEEAVASPQSPAASSRSVSGELRSTNEKSCCSPALPVWELTVLNHTGNDTWRSFFRVETCAQRLVEYAVCEIRNHVRQQQSQWARWCGKPYPTSSGLDKSHESQKTEEPALQQWRIVVHCVGFSMGGIVMRAALPALRKALEKYFSSVSPPAENSNSAAKRQPSQRQHWWNDAATVHPSPVRTGLAPPPAGGVEVFPIPRSHRPVSRGRQSEQKDVSPHGLPRCSSASREGGCAARSMGSSCLSSSSSLPSSHLGEIKDGVRCRDDAPAYAIHFGTFLTIGTPHLGSRVAHPIMRRNYKRIHRFHPFPAGLTSLSDLLCLNDFVLKKLVTTPYVTALRAFQRRVFMGAVDDKTVWSYSSCLFLPHSEAKLLEGWEPAADPEFWTPRHTYRLGRRLHAYKQQNGWLEDSASNTAVKHRRTAADWHRRTADASCRTPLPEDRAIVGAKQREEDGARSPSPRSAATSTQHIPACDIPGWLTFTKAEQEVRERSRALMEALSLFPATSLEELQTNGVRLTQKPPLPPALTAVEEARRRRRPHASERSFAAPNDAAAALRKFPFGASPSPPPRPESRPTAPATRGGRRDPPVATATVQVKLRIRTNTLTASTTTSPSPSRAASHEATSTSSICFVRNSSTPRSRTSVTSSWLSSTTNPSSTRTTSTEHCLRRVAERVPCRTTTGVRGTASWSPSPIRHGTATTPTRHSPTREKQGADDHVCSAPAPTTTAAENWITALSWPERYLPQERDAAIQLLSAVGPVELHVVDLLTATEHYLDTWLYRAVQTKQLYPFLRQAVERLMEVYFRSHAMMLHPGSLARTQAEAEARRRREGGGRQARLTTTTPFPSYTGTDGKVSKTTTTREKKPTAVASTGLSPPPDSQPPPRSQGHPPRRAAWSAVESVDHRLGRGTGFVTKFVAWDIVHNGWSPEK